jgi:hypothetical protein
MTTLPPNNPPAEMPLACVQCGEVTRHVCPYDLAPLAHWACEHARDHAPGRPRLFLVGRRERRGALN